MRSKNIATKFWRGMFGDEVFKFTTGIISFSELVKKETLL